MDSWGPLTPSRWRKHAPLKTSLSTWYGRFIKLIPVYHYMIHGIPPIAYGPHWHGMYKKIKILQESSTALNFQRKARVQCAYRKMQNKCIYKKQEQNKKEEKQTEHTRIPQLPHHGQSCNLKIKIKKKNRKTTARKRCEKTANCTKYIQAHYYVGIWQG